MSSDLRIYYGNARITIDAGDPRIAKIIGLVMQEVAPKEVRVEADKVVAHDAPLSIPRTDAEAMAMLRAYILKDSFKGYR